MNKFATFMRESVSARFFIPVGIILIIFGIIAFVITIKNQNYIEVEATITNIVLQEEEHLDNEGNRVEATYKFDIKYTVDGKEYTSDLDNMFKQNIGDKITIYYNPKDPSQITQTKSIIFPIIIIVAGIASLVGGIVSAVNAVKRHKKMEKQERSWANNE